ncbi:MAG: type I-B CRISPR-associated protein Cas8b1/Cst1 [Caldisericum sp.]
MSDVMERVYLGDWLYNAGILGFLFLYQDLWSSSTKDNQYTVVTKCDQLLRFGDNYIEFNRRIFEDFAKRVANYALEQYKRVDDFTKRGNNFTDYFKYIQIYHRNWYNGMTEEKFASQYVQKLINSEAHASDNRILTVDKQKISVPCVVCYGLSDRIAKKDKSFTTSLSTFAGLNADAINFLYFPPTQKLKSKVELPLCDICEIIYLSCFAGLTPVKRHKNLVLYFINSDYSIFDLVSKNKLLRRLVLDNQQDNINLLDYIIHLSSEINFRETAILELNLANSVMPRVYSFNLSEDKVRFFASFSSKESSNDKYFKVLSDKYYVIKKTKISIFHEVLSLILDNRLHFYYLNKLTRLFLRAKKSKAPSSITNIINEKEKEPYVLMILNLIITRFLQQIGGSDMSVTEEQLRGMYRKGKELASIMRKKNAENKIDSISYKLLNALRIRDHKQFMDVVLRTYIAYGEIIPSSFVKALQNNDDFAALGYSFLSGLHGEAKEEKEEVISNG